jgi:hypothetical protein
MPRRDGEVFRFGTAMASVSTNVTPGSLGRVAIGGKPGL